MSLGALLIILANTWMAAAFVMLALEAWWWAAAASGIGLVFALFNAGLRVQELRTAAWPDHPGAREAETASARTEAAPRAAGETRTKGSQQGPG